MAVAPFSLSRVHYYNSSMLSHYMIKLIYIYVYASTDSSICCLLLSPGGCTPVVDCVVNTTGSCWMRGVG